MNGSLSGIKKRPGKVDNESNVVQRRAEVNACSAWLENRDLRQLLWERHRLVQISHADHESARTSHNVVDAGLGIGKQVRTPQLRDDFLA
jgi:hypothetical protein